MCVRLHSPIPVRGGWAALAGWVVAAFAPIAVTGVGSGLAYKRPDACNFKKYYCIMDCKEKNIKKTCTYFMKN